MLCSLGSFPWDLLRRNAVFQVLTFSMQSPVIFMILAICGFVMLGCYLIGFYEQNKSAKVAAILEITVVVVSFVGAQYLVDGLLLNRAPLWVRESEDLADVVLIEAPQLQLSSASGKTEWIAVALGVISLLAILGYCMINRSKKQKSDTRREAA